MRLAITFDGLRMLIADLIQQGHQPAAVLLSPHEKRDLKQEIMSRSKEHSKDAEEWDHDLRAFAFIAGVPVLSHQDVPRGSARIIEKRAVHDRNRDHRVI